MALPSLAAGLALALSVPPFGWWPLAFAGAGLLYWRLAGLGWRTRLWSGWLAGLGCYVPGLWWADHFNWYGAVALMAAEALAMGLAAVAVPTARGRLPCFAGAFTLTEALRWRWPFGGLPLGGVFLGQATGPLLPLARAGGPLLLTAAVYATGAALAGPVAALARWRGGTRSAPPPGTPSVLTVAAAVAATLAAAALLAASVLPDGGAPVGSVAVAAVQGGGRRGTSALQVDPATVFAAQYAASARVRLPRGGRRLVVWPEDVVALGGPLAGSPQAAAMAGLARRLRATVVAGVTVPVPPAAFRNEVVAWGPAGRVVGVYEKVHRVPFGEYVPFRGLVSHLADLSAVPEDAVPGHGTGLLTTPAGPLGVMVSYEVFYADRARSAVGAGAELLVVPTNTSSYSTAQVPAQEVAADRVQAVSEGRDLVQAAPTGYSTVVSSDGTVRRQSALGARQVLAATVALRRGTTLYQRWGDLPVLVLSALAVAVGWLRARRRAGREDPGRTG